MKMHPLAERLAADRARWAEGYNQYILQEAVPFARGDATAGLLALTRNREWEPFDRSIDIRIGRLRRKVEPDPAG